MVRNETLQGEISNTAGQICVSGGACDGNFKDGIIVTTDA